MIVSCPFYPLIFANVAIFTEFVNDFLSHLFITFTNYRCNGKCCNYSRFYMTPNQACCGKITNFQILVNTTTTPFTQTNRLATYTMYTLVKSLLNFYF